MPRTRAQFVEYYRKSDNYRANWEDMASYHEEFAGKPERVTHYKQSVKAEPAKHSNKKSPFVVSIPMQARALMRRRAQILRGGISTQVIQLAVHIVQAIIMGSLPAALQHHADVLLSRWCSVLCHLVRRSVHDVGNSGSLCTAAYRASAVPSGDDHPFFEGLRVALTLVDVPISFVTQVVFGILVYFLVVLQQSAGQFL